MLLRTLFYVVPLLTALTVVTAYLYQHQRDDHLSVGRYAASDGEMYDIMLRKDGFARLSTEGLRELLDVTFYDIGNEWVLYYDAKGNGKYRSKRLRFSDGTFTDTGYREITDDGRYCTKWGKLRDGKRRCGRVWRRGELHYGMLKHGYIGSKYTVRRGNAENL